MVEAGLIILMTLFDGVVAQRSRKVSVSPYLINNYELNGLALLHGKYCVTERPRTQALVLHVGVGATLGNKVSIAAKVSHILYLFSVGLIFSKELLKSNEIKRRSVHCPGKYIHSFLTLQRVIIAV